jgi:hypothetical protein
MTNYSQDLVEYNFFQYRFRKHDLFETYWVVAKPPLWEVLHAFNYLSQEVPLSFLSLLVTKNKENQSHARIL